MAHVDDAAVVSAWAETLRAFPGDLAAGDARILIGVLSKPGLTPRAYNGIAYALGGSRMPDEIDNDLVRALPTIAEEDRRPIVFELSRRKHPAAIPYLRTIAEGTTVFAEQACRELAAIPDARAVAAALECLRRDAGAHPNLATSVAAALSTLPLDVPVDVIAVRRALPAKLEGFVMQHYANLVAKRGDKAGAAELAALVPQEAASSDWHSLPVTDAVLASNDPATWARARAALDAADAAGKGGPSSVAIRRRLDKAIADPSAARQAMQDERASQSMRKNTSAIDDRLAKLEPLRTSDPRAWADQTERELAALDAIAARDGGPAAKSVVASAGQRRMQLGAVVRFVLHEPERALKIYETAFSGDELAQGPLKALLVGDLLQFDLHDRARAVAVYRRGIAGLASMPARGGGAEVVEWWKAWYEREIGFLEHGTTSAGSHVDLEQCNGTVMIMGMAASIAGPFAATTGTRDLGRAPRGLSTQELDALPASHLSLLSMLSAPLPDDADAVVRAFARHDPSGGLTDCLVALVLTAERDGGRLGEMLPSIRTADGKDGPLLVASKRIAASSGRALPAADARKSSPEATWTLFLDSLRHGDAETALSCFGSERRAELRPLIANRSADDLRKLAESHVGFQVAPSIGQSYVEAAVTRERGTEKQVGIATFAKRGGEWVVVEGP